MQATMPLGYNYADVEALERTGQWPGGHPPAWAVALAAHSGVEVGSPAHLAAAKDLRIQELMNVLRIARHCVGVSPKYLGASSAAKKALRTWIDRGLNGPMPSDLTPLLPRITDADRL